jgi:hypothetical protein
MIWEFRVSSVGDGALDPEECPVSTISMQYGRSGNDGSADKRGGPDPH